MLFFRQLTLKNYAVNTVILLLFILTGCGGGGGGGGPSNGGSLSLSTNALAFTAISPSAFLFPQEITATFNGNISGTLFIKIVVSGPAVSSVSNVTITGSNTGTAFVTPASARALGVGTFTSTITVTACANDPTCATGQLAGSPQIINVSYQVRSSVQGDAVTPYVAIANTSGNVVIRGHGLLSTTNVAFGGINAQTFSVISDTEIRATHPMLAVDSYPVQLFGSSGAIPFTATLVVVSSPSYAGTTLAYPSSPQEIGGFLYDAERQALLVAARYATTSGNQILRYPFTSSSWQTPTSTVVPHLRDIALSLDGTRLLALADTALTQVDVATLAHGTTTDGSALFFGTGSFKNLAVANDGLAVVTAKDFGVYLYSTNNPAFYAASTGGFSLFNGNPSVSADGSFMAINQGQLSPAPGVNKYVASSGLLLGAGINLNTVSPNLPEINPAPALDRSGLRIALTNSTGDLPGGTHVLDAAFTTVADFPGTMQAVVFRPNPVGAATLVYTLDGCRLRAFNLAPFSEITTAPYPIPISCPGNHPKMAISPDGGTVFIAGDSQIIIQPTP
jgi:hypothetical protein